MTAPTISPLHHVMSPFITRVVVKDDKSIVECDVRLEPLNVLVGLNGSGKSNFAGRDCFEAIVEGEDRVTCAPLRTRPARCSGSHGDWRGKAFTAMAKQFGADVEAIVNRLDPAQRDHAQRDIEAIRRARGTSYSLLASHGARRPPYPRPSRRRLLGPGAAW